MTFSIAARCAETGQLGIAISSSSIAVGARCPWLLAGVGAVSSQNITLPALGPQALAQLEQQVSPDQALQQVLDRDGFGAYRQIIAIDAQGRSLYQEEQTSARDRLPRILQELGVDRDLVAVVDGRCHGDRVTPEQLVQVRERDRAEA